MKYFTITEKYQKYVNGVPTDEFKEGKSIGVFQFGTMNECEKYTPQITYNNWVTTGNGILTLGHNGFTINELEQDNDGLHHYTIEGAGTEIRFTSNIIYSHYIDLTNMTDLSNMDLCSSNYIGGDFSGWNTSNVTNMSNLFYTARECTTLDLSSFNTSNVTIMESMFSNCNKLTTLDISSFDTSNVTRMSSMFQDCHSLTTLDLSHFDTSNVEYMDCMFAGCSSLTTLDLSSFNTSKVKWMNGMFSNCNITTLDLSHFDTSNLTDTTAMFDGCTSLTTLNISGFDLTKTYTNNNRHDYMFEKCTSLQTIYAYGCNEATINCINENLSKAGLTNQVTIITQ